MADNTTPFKEGISAAELMEIMKNFKGGYAERQQFVPVVRKYINNYDIFSTKKEMLKNSIAPQCLDMTDIMDRFEHTRTLLAMVIPNVTRIICVTFKTAGFNFAYLYFTINEDKVAPLFYSIGENLVSTDGEWRTNFMDIGSYEVLMARYSKYVDEIEYDGEISNNIYYSSGLTKKYTKQLNKCIIESNYKKTLFAIARLSIKLKKPSKFVDIGIINVLDGPIPNISKEEAEDIKSLLSSIISRTVFEPLQPLSYKPVPTGQKLITLSVDEVSHPLNIANKAWGELQASRRTTDLILNHITPCFAIHGAWFFIYNSNENLFNSLDIKNKINVYSDILYNPDNSDVLSDVAVSIVNENVGYTFINSLPTKNIERSIFDIIFALYAMNVKLQLMHSDLHCNNVTRYINNKCDGWIIYNLSGVEYVLPHDGYYSCIVDFSRVIDTNDLNSIEMSFQKYEIHFPIWLRENKNTLLKIFTEAIDLDKIEYISKITCLFDIYEFSKSVLVTNDACDELNVLLQNIVDEAKLILKNIINIDFTTDIDWGNKQLINKIFKKNEDIYPDKIYGYYTDLNEMKYSIAENELLPQSFINSPMIANDNDTPVYMEAGMCSMIKMKYTMLKFSEKQLSSL